MTSPPVRPARAVHTGDDLVDRVVALLQDRPSGLITDIDGTISPVVALPEHARVIDMAREALDTLRAKIEVVAIVTGRSAEDAAGMVGLPGLMYVGNHGLEVWRDGRAVRAAPVEPWLPLMERAVCRLRVLLTDPGVAIEDKQVSATVHYRLAADPAGVLQTVVDVVDGIGDCLRLVLGNMVVNILPSLDVTKGTAVDEIAVEAGLRGVVYLGDDVTDTHAFLSLAAMRERGQANTLSIGVVTSETVDPIWELSDGQVGSPEEIAAMLGAVARRLLRCCLCQLCVTCLGCRVWEAGYLWDDQDPRAVTAWQ